MKVELAIDGETRTVDVDLAKGTVEVGGVTYPVQVIHRSVTGVELEIAGERVKVADWPSDEPSPTAPVTVSGERFAVRVRVEEPLWGGPAAPGPRAPIPAPAPGPTSVDAIVPPMPGRVIEVRVREGERVSAGKVLLVLEAMKMRNEIASPRAGVVRELRVQAGSLVKGREPMLRVVAEP